MKLTSYIDANNTNEELGQSLKENLELQGFKNVRVFQNPDDECLSVDGRIGERGKVTLEVNWKDDRREIILVDVYRRSKLIWSRIDVQDFPALISFAKLLVSRPLESISFSETTPKLVVEDQAEPILSSAQESLSVTEPLLPEFASLSEQNEAHKPKPTKSERLGSKATFVLSLFAIMTFGASLYLVMEVRSYHQQIKDLKEQLQNQR